MLLSTVNPAAAAAIGEIVKVGVGNRVVYHTRAGMMRQGRTSFPADVLRQHPDDGSLDLYVIMEPEEIIMEQRVQFRSHNQPHHCWSAVQDVPGAAPLLIANDPVGLDPDMANTAPGALVYPPQPDIAAALNELGERIAALTARFEPLLKRVTVLEMKRPSGRPPNTPKPESEAG